MKSWAVSDEIRQDPEVTKAVEAARDWLEDVIGQTSINLVDASWSMENVGAERKLWLTISDWKCPEGVRQVFEPTELPLELKTRRRFHRLWSNLLQARSHQLLRELQQLVAE